MLYKHLGDFSAELNWLDFIVHVKGDFKYEWLRNWLLDMPHSYLMDYQHSIHS